MMKQTTCTLSLIWTGNLGTGTSRATDYERSHVIQVEGKPDLLASSDSAYRGDSTRWNPEELLLSSISGCFMLWYLYFCSQNGIIVEDYQDKPNTLLQVETNGIGKIVKANLNPTVFIKDESKHSIAQELVHKAHQHCFIANSVNFPIEVNLTTFNSK